MHEVKAKEPAAYKAIMFCNDIHDTNNYDHDVFTHNSVDGVRRITFRQYLRIISEPHMGTYQLEKVYPDKLLQSGTAQADAEYIRTHIKTDSYSTESKSDKVHMAFRAIWAAATGELMQI